MSKNNNTMLIPITFSVLILIGGLVGAYFLHGSMSKPVVAEQASLLGEIPQSDDERDFPADLKQIINDSQKRVVSLEVDFMNGGQGIGSGFLYNNQGDIITNAHVVVGAVNIVVKGADTSLHQGKLIGMSEEKDLAVVRVEGLAKQQPLSIARKKKIEIGDAVLAFGSPHGLENTVTTGIISGLNRDLEIENSIYRGVYQTSAPIAPGNSGGPLILEKTGEVIGVNSAAGRGAGNIGFSIPIDQALALVEKWSASPDTHLAAQSSTAAGDGQLVSYYTETTFSEDAGYLLDYFYGCISAKDYVTAYSLLGSKWQSGTSYETFRNGYLNTMDVTTQSINTRAVSDSTAEVTVIIEALEHVDGAERLTYYKLDYNVGIENENIKILSGKGKKIQ
ncbi:hypothetical protein BEP19_08790 [Ammoniphilus oxalaticus]|uniref:Peptidase S1 n=1 Tax=Ammoniphilus oxalaticus TaxID=66863 RepID=A0A419SKB3_9BACL|nr:trypsin-like peptidase domain-containing protein [Ammoniphilus oxalaticus]RKD24474.1 hypothetical protein BEP19_08790 [Ammoniphilus oxalaticus]